MREFTLDLNQAIRIGRDIVVENLPRHQDYVKCRIARIGIDAPREVNIRRSELAHAPKVRK